MDGEAGLIEIEGTLEPMERSYKDKEGGGGNARRSGQYWSNTWV